MGCASVCSDSRRVALWVVILLPNIEDYQNHNLWHNNSKEVLLVCQAACIIAQRGCLEFAFAVFTGHVICVERAGTKSNNVPATMMYLPVQGYI